MMRAVNKIKMVGFQHSTIYQYLLIKTNWGGILLTLSIFMGHWPAQKKKKKLKIVKHILQGKLYLWVPTLIKSRQALS